MFLTRSQLVCMWVCLLISLTTGFFAPAIVFVLRLLQGLALGDVVLDVCRAVDDYDYRSE